MRRKSKKLKSEHSKYIKKRKKSSNNDCIYIGKENIQRWEDLKTKFNFVSNSEFTSFLLDFFVSEKW